MSRFNSAVWRRMICPARAFHVGRHTGLLERGAGGGYRAERIAKLVAQHREERVARAQRRFRF